MKIVLVLNNVRSAHNVGAIMRTCDGAGIDKLILTGITPRPPHLKIAKTALGAEDFISWEYQKELSEVIKNLKKEDYEIAAIEQADNSISYAEYKLTKDTAFILGNEITGIDPEILSISDKIVELPMKGKKQSLNVATTAGIIAYHFKFICQEK